MNLEELFCPNIDCPARGQKGEGNIRSHSLKEQRCRCKVCGKTFTVSKGTPFYRLRTNAQIVMWVVVLLAFGLDERTVRDWQQRAGTHCEAVHDQIVGQAQLELQQVQADEIKAKIVRGHIWLAMAIMVPTRLWLGGEISHKRDKHLIRRLAARIRAIALCRPLLLAVDGLPGYVKAFQGAFRSKAPRGGQKGRCQLIPWSDIAIVQVIKRRSADAFRIERRIVQGCPHRIDRLRQATQAAPLTPRHKSIAIPMP